MTLITAPITAFLGTALKQASDQQTVLAQLEATLKSTGGAAGMTADELTNLGDSLSKVTRFSDDAIGSAENLLLTFTSIGRDIFPEATKTVLDMSTALGQDLKSSAIQLGKALNDPITGITALRRVGVQFTDAQEAQIKVLVESNDLLGAQTLILKELQKEFGGSAEAAGKTFAGQMDILTHKFEDFQEKIGFILMPVLERLIGVLGRVLDRVVAWTTKHPKLTAVIVAFAAALVALGPALIVIGTAMKAFSAISAAVQGFNLLTFAVGALSSPLVMVGAAIAATVVGLGVLATALGVDVLGGLRAVGDQVQVFAARVGESGLTSAIRNLFTTFEDGSSTISTLLEGFGMGRDKAQAWADSINKVVGPALDKFFEFLRFLPGHVESAFGLVAFYAGVYFGKVRDFFETQVVAPIRGLGIVVGKLLQPVIDWFNVNLLPILQQVPGWITDNIITPLQDIWAELQVTLQPVADFVRGVFQPVLDYINAVYYTAKSMWELLGKIGGNPLTAGSASQSSKSNYWTSGGSSPAAYDFTGMSAASMSSAFGNPQVVADRAAAEAAAWTAYNAQHRALGGPVMANRPYTVGEQGREVFIPSTNGSIVSNDRLGGKMLQWNGNLVIQGDGSVNVNREQFEAWMEAWYLALDDD